VGLTEEGVLAARIEVDSADAGEVVLEEAGPAVEAEITVPPPRTPTEVHPIPTPIHVLEDTLATPMKQGGEMTTTVVETVLGEVAVAIGVEVIGVTIPTVAQAEEVVMVTGTVIGLEEVMEAVAAAVEAMVEVMVAAMVEAMVAEVAEAEAMVAEVEAMVDVEAMVAEVEAMGVGAEAQASPNRTNKAKEETGEVPMIRTVRN